MYNRLLGNLGEKAAINFLIEKGYYILHKNWRHKNLEIDVIAKQDQYLVFVEVKTRTQKTTGTPNITITETKQERLLRAAENYIEQYSYNGEIRFDVISVWPTTNKNSFEIELITNAFR